MLATGAYVIVLRILHIFGGVAWGGSVFLFVVFVQPSSASIGPAAGPFMQELLGRRKLVNYILWIAALTIVAGLLLYWRDWHAFGSFSDWIGSRLGLILTIGGLSAIVGFGIGLFGTKPGVDRLMALARRAAEAGGSPAPEVLAEIPRLQARLKALARTNLAFIAIAVLAMSTARYW